MKTKLVFTSAVWATFSFLATVSLFAAVQENPSADTIDFDRQIKPILSDRCFTCHGPDAAQRRGDLRLDEEASAREVISAGDPDDSELYLRIVSDDESERMPPLKSGLSINKEEAELLRKWIEQGAAWKEHWAFTPPQPIVVPKSTDNDWCENAIDHFILGRLESVGMKPNEPATKAQLIRRLSFDLNGLPPTLDEIDHFLNDHSANAYENLVDRLLASPRFGERLASDWMDAARYSDTFGYHTDRDRAVWAYRDWVIAAFNDNLSYDRFIVEQLAGDLLPDATDQQILATCFNRLHPQKVEGGSVPEEFRVEYVADRTHTFATAFMGMTLECARCHDHKFDPISQEEYYQLFAFFNNQDEAGLYSHFTTSMPTPTLLLTTDAEKRKLAELRAAVERRVSEGDKLRETLRKPFLQWRSEFSRQELAQPSRRAAEATRDIDLVKVAIGENRRVADFNGSPAIQLTGDQEVGLGAGNYRRYQPFSISLWIWTPDKKDRAVVFHRSKAWTDAGSRGYQLLIEEGRLSGSLIHFWPGNGIRVVSEAEVPTQTWTHVAMVYDGSSRADGLKLFMNGQLQPTVVVRDHLLKKITGGGQDHLALGARFRDRGFTGGKVSEVQIHSRQLAQIEVSRLAGEHDQATKQLRDDEVGFEYYLLNHSDAYSKWLESVQQARKQLCDVYDSLSEIMVMREMPNPRPAFVLERGLYDRRKQSVSPDTPEILGAFPSDSARNRLGLARWLTRPDHPLTARVAVNRYWQMIFGKGLVRTPEDFGRQGASPTHPELLDWLAVDFVKHGWDVKRLVKQLVMSKTYRLSSRITLEQLRQDPDNRWLARAPRYRWPAEMLRDNALAVSGSLVEKIGGPSVKPYEVAYSFKPVAHDKGEGLYRRSLYTYWKRTGPAPVMMALDASKRNVCRVKRETTSSPLQSLVLMNGPQFVEAARKTAERLLKKHDPDESADQIAIDLYRLLTGRFPKANERKLVLSLQRQQLNYFKRNPDSAEAYLKIGWSSCDPAIPKATLASWASVVNTLMSLDECMTKR